MSKKDETIPMPSESAFSLKKVSIKNAGINIHYEVTEVVNEESYSNKCHVETTKDIHPDLKKLFDDLRPVLGRLFNQTSFKSVLATPDFKATKKQLEIGDKFAEKILENTEVRGISLNGDADNVGVVLTGLYTFGNGQKGSINSHNIKLNSENYGFEADLEEIIIQIETEIYAFLFKGKKATLTLFDASGESAVPEIDEDEENLFTGTDDAVNDAEETETDDAETETEENDDAVNDDDDAESFSDDEEKEEF